MFDQLTTTLQTFEAQRHNPVLLYITGEQTFPPKTIEEYDIPPLYDCLRAIGPTHQLDLILHTVGGHVNTCRKMSLLLREFAQHVTVFVTYKARSAGTLLCLSADQIIMSPIAELGPIDPHQISNAPSQAGGPPAISSESIRAYKHMAEDWFGLPSDQHAHQLFSVLNQHIFPTSLSTFWSADQQMRCIASELLEYQIPHNPEARATIVEQLISGYHAHDYCITAHEARDLGLCVTHPEAEEELLLWSLWHIANQCFLKTPANVTLNNQQERIDSIMATAHQTHIHLKQPPEFLPVMNGNTSTHVRRVSDTYWQKLE
ncbi:MAG: hypothetical protein GFH27_549303n59 [Chloroflexi bacterium AL-W]|nr:hypothetical protein [Chloroflexi bacterium AL-N1]NOK67944.1 hypothetical protein [Chloroflexi bacterium AL-N10]NOK73284.1 hypothetical protein [Chloroflexi bacterium AL-N5]NOK83198.1 hypothetical protein [Chloroflexi bacterium AL-W]NOK87615.1 hypothetical protein [Chloroflexi bacterium AL-N15]